MIIRVIFSNVDKPVKHQEDFLPHKDKEFYGIQGVFIKMKGDIIIKPIYDIIYEEWSFKTS